MRKILLSVALATGTLAAMPASAQAWRVQPAVQRQIQSDINQLNNQVQRAAQRRTITQREANGLNRDTVQLQRLHNRYARGGLTRAEVSQLELQVNRLRQQLRLERRDWDGRRG